MQHDFILLDRSGSMASMWAEALTSINTYVRRLADDGVDTGVTLALFDSGPEFMFNVVRDRITPSTWRPVTVLEYEPRGMTPLNDAIGRIVALAKAGKYDKVALLIVTDGLENASKEFQSDQAKQLLDECRERGWAVTFLGANFAGNARQARSYGAAGGQHVNSTMGNMAGTMRAMADKRSLYASAGATQDAMEWTEEEKTKAEKPHGKASPQ